MYPRVFAPMLQPPVLLDGEVVVAFDPTQAYMLVVPEQGKRALLAKPTHSKLGPTTQAEAQVEAAVAKHLLAELSRDDWPSWLESRLQGVVGPS
jgi:hypothetical protein